MQFFGKNARVGHVVIRVVVGAMLKGSEQSRKQGREETSGDDMRLLGNIVCIECLSCGCHSNFHGKSCTCPCRHV
jgi:hypothetical protein